MTWNINSLRLRLPQLQRLIEAHPADVICLQETKVPDDLFPAEALKNMGYPHLHYRGMKGYNGVAVLSRHPMTNVDRYPNWCGKSDSRHVSVVLQSNIGPITLHDFYVPAGGDIADPDLNPKFAHKLSFLEQVTQWFEDSPPTRSIIAGDLNVAPLENDVWSHQQLLKVVSHTPPEVDRLNAWMNTGFADAMRTIIPADEKLYTWWSYRNRDWRASNRGRRLDHFWLTKDVLPLLQDVSILKDVRDWEKTSDHVPVKITLNVLPH